MPSPVPVTSGPSGTDESVDLSTAVTAAVQAAGRGDVSAFERLHRMTVARATAIARSIIVDPGQAEEGVQEAYLEIWRWADRYDPALGSALPWMLRIVRNRCIDRVRQCAAARAREVAFVREQSFVPPEEAILDRIMRAEVCRELVDALGRLTDRQREALWLTYFGYRSGPQISTQLGIPLGTVKSRIRDGVLSLRAMSPALE